MKKRIGLIGAALLALCFIVGVLPAPAGAASGTDTHNNHDFYGKLAGEDGAGDIVTFTAWESESSLPTDAGNYYLTKNVSLSNRWLVTANITLCLNGYVIQRGADFNGAIIRLTDHNLTICDCNHERTDDEHKFMNYGLETPTEETVTGGLIAGATPGNQFTAMGGGVVIGDISQQSGADNTGNAVFKLYGGTIAGNENSFGGGVCVKGPDHVFEMYGGTIKGNRSTASGGGGIYVGGRATVEIRGGTITGNNGLGRTNGGGISATADFGGAPTIKIYGGNMSGNREALLGSSDLKFKDTDMYLYGGPDTPYTIIPFTDSGNPRPVKIAAPLNAAEGTITLGLARSGNSSFLQPGNGTTYKVAEWTNDYSGDEAAKEADLQKFQYVAQNPANGYYHFYRGRDGVTGEDTNAIYVALHVHTAGSGWESNATNHWHECVGDGLCDITDNSQKDGYAAHNWTAYGDTYNANGHYRKCADCGYVETTQRAHSFTITSRDATGHTKTCACGYSENASHNYGTYQTGAINHNRTCTVAGCGYVDSGEHSFGAYTDQNNGTHGRTCGVCSYVDSGGHTYNNSPNWQQNTDAATGHYKDCDSCSYRLVAEHRQGSWQAQGDSGHTWACQDCSYSPAAVGHTYGDWVTTGADQHWKVCNVCSYQGEKGNHDFEWKSDAGKHWQECKVCHRKQGETAHTWDNSALVKDDGEHHWYKCTEPQCNARKDEAKHQYTLSKNDDTNHWKECVCGRRFGEEAHQWGPDWEQDGTNHWHECDCGAKTDVAVHNSTGGWKIGKDGNNDVHYQVCDECSRRFGDTSHTVDMDNWVYHVDTPYNPNDPDATDKCRWHACSVCEWADPSTISGHDFTRSEQDADKHWTACTDCGLTINEQVHTYSGEYLEDGNEHYKKCDGCDYRGHKGTHNEDKMEYDEDGHWTVCSVCEKEVGGKENHDKEYSPDSLTGDSHWQICTTTSCDWESTAEGHDYTSVVSKGPTGHTKTCACGHSEDVQHSYGEYQAGSDGKHTRTCTVAGCGYVDEGEHQYPNSGAYTDQNDGSHSRTCEVCSYKDSGDHIYDNSPNWRPNDVAGTGHYKACDSCGHRSVAAHKPGSWQAQGDSGHNWTCEDCGYSPAVVAHTYGDWVTTGADQHWKVCSVCGYEGEKDSHDFEWKSDAGKHWQECTVCHKNQGETAHTWDNSALVKDDSEHHWYKCTEPQCNARKDEAKHQYTLSKNDDTNHWKECVCGKRFGEEAHQWGPDWEQDGTNHWHECDCGAKTDVAVHNSTGGWKPGKDGNNDVHYQVCDECGRRFGDVPHTVDKTDWVYHTNSDPSKPCRWYACSACGWADPSTISGHDFTRSEQDADKHWTACTDCGLTINEQAHTYSGEYLKDGNTHYKKCDGCDYRGLEGAHNENKMAYDEDGHWTVCSVCEKQIGTKENHGKDYSPDSLTGDSHWQICMTAGCGWKSTAEGHDYTRVMSTDPDGHWKECDCGKASPKTIHTTETKWDGEKHWEECTNAEFGCTWKGTETSHSYDNGMYGYDAEEHWLVCDDCEHGEQDRAGHEYSNVDTECDTCGYQCYIVTFDSKGGSAVAFQRVPATDGKAVRPANPTRSGYTFDGWCTDEGVTTAWDFNADVTGSMTLYAKWKKNSGSGGNQGSGWTPGGPPSNPTPPTKPDTTTTITKNPDGSTTTTVTNNKTGVVTETTPDKPNGNRVIKETDDKKDVTITVISSSGEQLAKVELPARTDTSGWRFVDVPVGHWADQGIHEMAAMGVIKGVGDNRYSMNNSIKRGDLATMFCRLSQGNADPSVLFVDVPVEKYYASGITWSNKVGVVKGYGNGYFLPENAVTRQELATMLYRYAELLNMGGGTHGGVLSAFVDGHRVSSWATDGMAWCVANGVVEGKGNGILDPTANVTRAEAAVMLRRFLDLAK